MGENWVYQWSGKDASGGMLNIRAETADELRQNIANLFGASADGPVLAGFTPERKILESLSTGEVARELNAEVVGSSVGNQTCPQCGVGKLQLKTGKRGKFYGCSNFPTCRHTKDV